MNEIPTNIIDLDLIVLDWSIITVEEGEKQNGKVVRYIYNVPTIEMGRKVGYLACSESLRSKYKPQLEDLDQTIENLRLDGNQMSFSEYPDEGVVEIQLRGNEWDDDYYKKFNSAIEQISATKQIDTVE